MADTFDIYYTAKDPTTVEGLKIFTFNYNRSIAVRGPWKLVGIWLKCLMTLKGSDPAAPEYGTEFSALIGSNITSVTDVRDVVLLAINDCNDQILTLQRTTQPAKDEMLLSAVLVRFERASPDSLDAWVEIKNVEGSAITTPLPLNSVRT